MDRKYKRPDSVFVFATVKQDAGSQQVLDAFVQRPRSSNGYDNYVYKGRAYKGYLCHGADACIFLDAPLTGK